MVLFNPPAHLFGTENAVLTARGVRRYEHRFDGPLSVKAVIAGSATWETADGRFDVVPGSVLLLEDGEEYEITVDALQPVETFCFFFGRGFVEDAQRAATTGSDSLLDAAPLKPTAFAEKLHFDAPLVTAMQRAHGRMRAGLDLDESFYATALELVRTQRDFASRVSRIPALRAATREELGRRVAVATAFLHANLDRNVTVAEAAGEACLSPFHFHRLFAAIHGTTPHRYLTKLRLEKAKAMLRSSDVPVTSIAADCGFESTGSFSTLFKRTFGVTPGAIRRNEEAPRAAPR
ncbi:MAG TPA: AraC family transcriptional regulator [Thermoanaerobaculia bacterium]|nr:AraC family transcriptional regulator [Thermoanaerobaculia bacterium]